MGEFSPIKQNILQYLDFKGISRYEFYKKTGISKGILEQNNGISEQSIQKTLSYYTDINPLWLITGKGEMLISTNQEVQLTSEVNEPSLSYGSVPRKEPVDAIVKYLEGKIDKLESELRDMAGTIAVLKHQLDHTTKKTVVFIASENHYIFLSTKHVIYIYYNYLTLF